MQLSFDTEKFRETNLRLYDYMLLVLYSIKDYYSAKELAHHLNVTERTALEKRRYLVDFGWLVPNGCRYYLTSESKQALAA